MRVPVGGRAVGRQLEDGETGGVHETIEGIGDRPRLEMRQDQLEIKSKEGDGRQAVGRGKAPPAVPMGAALEDQQDREHEGQAQQVVQVPAQNRGATAQGDGRVASRQQDAGQTGENEGTPGTGRGDQIDRTVITRADPSRNASVSSHSPFLDIFMNPTFNIWGAGAESGPRFPDHPSRASCRPKTTPWGSWITANRP